MMYPSDMSRISILMHKKDSESVIKKLHESGLMEITKSKREYFREGKMHPLVEECALYELRLSRIIDILKSYETKKGLKDIFRKGEIKKIKVRRRSFDEKIEDAKKLLDRVEEKVIEMQQRMEKLEEEKEEVKNRIEKLRYLALFDIDISWLGKTRYSIIKFGIMSDKPPKVENIKIYSKRIEESKEEKYAVLIVAPSRMEDEIKKLRFEEISVEGKGKARKLLKESENKLKEIEKRRKEIIAEMRKLYKKEKLNLLAAREEIHIEKEEREIQASFGESNFTFLIEGYALSKDVEKLKEIVENETHGKCFFHAKKVPRNQNAPIHLKNPKWAKPFETFVELFSLPKYNEANPTILIGISFIIFFSFMLGDAGYGLVIFLLSLLGYFKFKKSEFIRQWAFVGIWLGVGNIFTGFLFNGFFGDFIPRFIYHNPEATLYHATLYGIDLPIDAIHKPVIILAIALMLGLIHLNLGFIMGAYQNIKRKTVKNILVEQFPWFILQIGGGMLIGSSLLNLWQLGNIEKIFAYAITLIGLIILFKSNGPLGFFDITGYLGDWLSYARLLALGLATAGMALAFNIVSEMLPTIIPYIGIVLVPIVLLITHLANLMIQSLGAAIHALRLQYVEFFNRFYEGGGKRFKPFSISRKYTEEIK